IHITKTSTAFTDPGPLFRGFGNAELLGSVLDELLSAVACWRLRIDTKHRLRTGCAHHQPAILEQVLEAIQGLQLLYLRASHGAQPSLLAEMPKHVLLSSLGRVQVNPATNVRAEFLVQLRNQLGKLLPSFHQHLRDEQADEESIALRNMSFHRDAARLLPPNQNVLLDDFSGDVLEADRCDIDLEPVGIRHSIDQTRGGERFYHLAGEAPVLVQILDEEREDGVRIDVCASFIEHAHPIGVSVVRDAHVAAVLDNAGAKRLQIPLDGLRSLAVKPGIPVAPDLDDGAGAE